MESKKDEMEKEQIDSNKGKRSKIIVIAIVLVIAILAIGLYARNSGNKIHIEPYEEDNCTQSNSNKSQSNSEIDYRELIEYVDKPIIYLYPEEEIEITVKLGKKEKITCSYPEYKDGWNVVAKPDGTLIDTETGRTLYALYWEGINNDEYNYNEGFIVKGSETIEFLEEKLEILGLNEREAEEFIVYWLPKLQENEYNYIRFATTDEINENMPLEFSVEPDTLIRVLMQFKGLDEYIEIQEQKLTTPERNGFTVVEWGGTEIK